MAADDGPVLRRRLVADLEARGYLRGGSVRDAFLSVRREAFLPDVVAREGLDAVYRDVAYAAKVDALGRWTSSSSQPAIMAAMLESLDLHPGLRVLEVGTGTGYNAALLARMVGPEGRVVTVDIDEDLVVRARPALAGVGVDVEALVADGRSGCSSGAPYDRIVITASSATIERAWLDQLSEDGLVELPLRLSAAGLPGQAIVTFRRLGDTLRSVEVTTGGFMALRDPGDRPAIDPGPWVSASAGRRTEHDLLASLGGHRMSSVAPSEQRKLLARSLAAPRKRALDRDEERAHDLDWTGLPAYVVLADGDRGRLIAYAREGVQGVALPAKTGMAVLCWRTQWTQLRPGVLAVGNSACEPTSPWLETYGNAPDAEAALLRTVDAWRRRGSPSVGALRIVVAFDRRPPRRAWRTLERNGALMSLDWDGL